MVKPDYLATKPAGGRPAHLPKREEARSSEPFPPGAHRGGRRSRWRQKWYRARTSPNRRRGRRCSMTKNRRAHTPTTFPPSGARCI